MCFNKFKRTKMKKNILSLVAVMAVLFAFGTSTIFAQQVQSKKKTDIKEQVKTTSKTVKAPKTTPVATKKEHKVKIKATKKMKKTEATEKRATTKVLKTHKSKKVKKTEKTSKVK